jgi:CHAT domain-containing protein/tetratricopeptide (TPR) repeat protein
MEPVSNLAQPEWSFRWISTRLIGLALALVFGGCSSDLSPTHTVLATSISIDDSNPHKLSFDALADGPVLVTVAGHGVDVRVALASTHAQPVQFADAPNRRMGVETLLVEAGHAPLLSLVIERNDHPGAHGRADVTVVALPVETESDRRRLEACRLESGANREITSADDGDSPANHFLEAARLYGENGETRSEGLALLHAAGIRYVSQSDWANAAELAARAEPLLSDAGAAEYAAFAIRVEGAALDQRANSAGETPAQATRDASLARDRLTAAADAFMTLGDPYQAGYAINYRGVSYDVAGERDKARADFLAALELFRKSGDQPAQALSLQSLALQSHQDGRLSDAMAEFDRALALIPRDEDPEDYAHTLHNSAWPLRALGRFDEAIARFYEAAQILHEHGDRNGEARALHGLGTTLMYAGEPERAAELLKAAIALRGGTGAKREQAISTLALGQLEIDAGNPKSAIANIERALALLSAPHDAAQARLLLARARVALGDLRGARRDLEAILALQLPPTHRYVGLAMAELGGIEVKSGHHATGIGYYQRALEVLQEGGSDFEHARTLVRLADVRLATGDMIGAASDSQDAISQLDAIGYESLEAESRSMFRASNRDAVEIYVAAQLEEAGTASDDAKSQNALRLALAASDKGRAALLGRGVAGSGNSPPQLLEERRETFERLAGKRQLRERLIGGAQPDEGRINELTREIALLRAKAGVLESRIARLSPGRSQIDLAKGRFPQLPDHVVAAEYFVGQNHCWVFVVRGDEIRVHELGSPREITRLARDLHAEWRRAPAQPGNRQGDSTRLAELLFQPLGPMSSATTLHVVPDGALHLVPIVALAAQALPSLQPGATRVAPAFSALLADTPSSDAAPARRLAIIADPIYAADDPRVAGGAAGSAPFHDELLTRGAATIAQLKRLPAAASEARAIASLADNEVLTLTGADAGRERLASTDLGDFRILHFATHAIADSVDPALATIVLSRFDAKGRPEDGAFRYYEISALRLNADLVVLSACDTAVGREVAGEGPIGLAQAFMRAGARSVVATLWEVPDTSTALLMTEFYKQMFVEHRRPAAALAAAQASLRHNPRWSDPYYWAGFQLFSTSVLEDGNNNVNDVRG